MENQEQIGRVDYRDDKIRAAMGVHRLTDQELASRTGLSRHTVAQVSDGVAQNPTVETLRKIGEVLGLTLQELFEPREEVA